MPDRVLPRLIFPPFFIATYLLLIWMNKMPKSFVDLGCGNGLLVYLLTKEGIPGGVGLDIRKRKIWNYFREEGTDLRYEK